MNLGLRSGLLGQSDARVAVNIPELYTMLCRNNTGFLPAALVLGLQPGVPLIIPILVVAEDGVTSQRYFVSGAIFLIFNCSCSASLPTLFLPDLTMKSLLKLTWAAGCNTWRPIKLAPNG